MDLLLAGLADGRYHLILGAGASFGVRNTRGELPMADGLTKILLDGVQGAPKSVTLQRAFLRAVNSHGEEYVDDLLRSYFAGCSPLPWHLEATRMPWQAVWTFNVDDAIEQAYVDNTSRLQTARTVVWRDPPLPLAGARDEVPIVHLHGYVGQIDRRDRPDLVFSLEQYLSALRAADTGNWQTRFRGEYQTAPVIVVGAQLHEEIDLAAVIQAGNHSAEFGVPSFIVRPGMSDFEKDEYRDWGLYPVSATADEFFDLLVPAMAAASSARADGLYESRYTRTTFYSLPLRIRDEGRPDPRHDFYGGYEPLWSDILANLDAVPGWIRQLAGEIGGPSECPDKQVVYYLHGTPFSGKSTALLRLVRELMKQGWRVEMLGGSERIDVSETLAYLKDRPNAVLVIDDLRGDARDVSDLLARAEQAQQRLLVFASDRNRLLIHAKRVVASKYMVGIDSQIFIEPTNALWGSILRKRSQAGRLGRLEGKDERTRALHFVEHERNLYSSLASLEDADGFIDRGIGVFDSLDPNLQSVFATVSLYAAVGLDAPVFSVAAASSVRVDRLMAVCQPDGELGEWVSLTGNQAGFLRLRHRYLGELLTSHLADGHSTIGLPDLLRAVLISISDRVSIEGVRQRDFFHRAASQMMDIAFVQRLLGREDVDSWYESLRPHYKWQARFWEQRALGLPDALDKAYSYAERAVDLHRDAFSLNTLGTVLMRRAAHPNTDNSMRQTYWQQAVGALAESREDGRGRFDFPFMTFFSHSTRILEYAKHDSTWLAAMEHEVRAWASSAAQASLGADVDVARSIARFPAAWTSSFQAVNPANSVGSRSSRRRRPRPRGPSQKRSSTD